MTIKQLCLLISHITYLIKMKQSKAYQRNYCLGEIFYFILNKENIGGFFFMLFYKEYWFSLLLFFCRLSPSDGFFQNNRSSISSQFLANNNAMSPVEIKKSDYFEKIVKSRKSITSTLNDNGTVFSDNNNASTYNNSNKLKHICLRENTKESQAVMSDSDEEGEEGGFEVIDKKNNNINIIEYKCFNCDITVVITKKEENKISKDGDNFFCSEKCLNDYKSIGCHVKNTRNLTVITNLHPKDIKKEVKSWYHEMCVKYSIKEEVKIIEQKVWERRALIKENHYNLIKEKKIMNLNEEVRDEKEIIFELEKNEHYMYYFFLNTEFTKNKFDFYTHYEVFYEWKEDYIKKLWNLIKILADLVNDPKESTEYEKALNASIRKKLYFIKVPEKKTIARLWGFTCAPDEKKDYLFKYLLPIVKNKTLCD